MLEPEELTDIDMEIMISNKLRRRLTVPEAIKATQNEVNDHLNDYLTMLEIEQDKEDRRRLYA